MINNGYRYKLNNFEKKNIKKKTTLLIVRQNKTVGISFDTHYNYLTTTRMDQQPGNKSAHRKS